MAIVSACLHPVTSNVAITEANVSPKSISEAFWVTAGEPFLGELEGAKI
jgi:hypothetical protein